MERNLETQNQSANYRKFLTGRYPLLNTLEPILGQAINLFGADELIEKLIQIRGHPIFSSILTDRLSGFRIYLVEILKSASQVGLMNLMACRIGVVTFPTPMKSTTDFRNAIINGKLDDQFTKGVFAALGADFFDKSFSARCEELNNFLETELFYLFERNSIRSKEFIAAVIPLPQNIPISEDMKNALIILSARRFRLFMTEEQIIAADTFRSDKQPPRREPRFEPTQLQEREVQHYIDAGRNNAALFPIPAGNNPGQFPGAQHTYFVNEHKPKEDTSYGFKS